MRRNGSVRALLLIGGLGVVASSCELKALPCPDSVCGSRDFEGLSAPVEVLRDGSGIVHLYGKTDDDVAFASGYMQATDRLLQMELQKRRARGTLASALGEGAVSDDRIVRLIDIPKLGKQNEEALYDDAPTTHRAIQAWTAGINRRVDEVIASGALPPGFEELGIEPTAWDVTDGFAIGKLIVFGNGNQLQFDILASAIQRFAPDLFTDIPFYTPIEEAFILGDAPKTTSSDHAGRAPRAHAAPTDLAERMSAFRETWGGFHPGASNNWAVDGRHTASGRSMIAGDPHQGLKSPSLMWLHHMNSRDGGGNVDAIGWSFVGTPGISLGHNATIAWTATTNYPDVTDIFDVVVEGNEAIVGGERVTIVTRVETVEVKGGAPVEITLEEVPGFGVLLPDDLVPIPLVDGGHRMLFNWTGFRPTHEADSFRRFLTAEDLDTFDAAVDDMELGSFNWIAATKDAITYRSSPLVPDRGKPSEQPSPAFRMLDGSNPKSLWNGTFLDPTVLPRSRAEATGILVSANNDPYGFTADGDLTNDPFYFGAYFDPGCRAARARSRIDEIVASRKLTLDDFEAIQTDTHSRIADELLPLLFEAHAAIGTDATLVEFSGRADLDALVTMLKAWDRTMERSLTAPVAFEAFMYFLVREAAGDDLSIFFEPILGEEPFYAIKFAMLALRDADGSLIQEGKRKTLLLALDATAALLMERYGAVDDGFVWGDFHRTAFYSESATSLDGGQVPTDGAEGVINVSSGRFFDGENVVQNHVSQAGAIYRMVATFDEDGVPVAHFNMPRGIVGDPESPWYDHLTEDWVEDTYRPLLFRTADVEKDVVDRMTLSP